MSMIQHGHCIQVIKTRSFVVVVTQYPRLTGPSLYCYLLMMMMTVGGKDQFRFSRVIISNISPRFCITSSSLFDTVQELASVYCTLVDGDEDLRWLLPVIQEVVKKKGKKSEIVIQVNAFGRFDYSWSLCRFMAYYYLFGFQTHFSFVPANHRRRISFLPLSALRCTYTFTPTRTSWRKCLRSMVHERKHFKL